MYTKPQRLCGNLLRDGWYITEHFTGMQARTIGLKQLKKDRTSNKTRGSQPEITWTTFRIQSSIGFQYKLVLWLLMSMIPNGSIEGSNIGCRSSNFEWINGDRLVIINFSFVDINMRRNVYLIADATTSICNLALSMSYEYIRQRPDA